MGAGVRNHRTRHGEGVAVQAVHAVQAVRAPCPAQSAVRNALSLALLVAWCLWLAACAAIGAPTSVARPAARPNIVLIMVDDLGYGELGCYGQQKIRTPNLDRMAAEGMRFTRFYASAPVCAPTRAMLLTGMHSGHACIRDNGESRDAAGKSIEGQTPFPAGTRTLGTAMQDLGYATALVGKWGNGGPGSTGEPRLMGFDFSYGYLCQRQAHNFYPTHLWRNGVREGLPGNTQGNIKGETYAQDRFIEETIAYVEARASPFFLYLPYTIPHAAIQATDADLAVYADEFPETPYEGGRGYLKHATPRAGYAAMITRLDRDVGLLLDALKAHGLDDNTLVLFTSDNGPTHDVGGVDTVFFNSAGGLRGRKGSLWEGGIRVPFIARWPGAIAAGTESAHRCATHDLYPTIVAAAGGPTPPSIDGVSFLPTLLGAGAGAGAGAASGSGAGLGVDAQPLHEYLYWETPGYGAQQAVLMGDWKGIRRDMGKGNMRVELYDLANDPAESRDVSEQHPERVDRMRIIMETGRTPSAKFPMPGLDVPAKVTPATGPTPAPTLAPAATPALR